MDIIGRLRLVPIFAKLNDEDFALLQGLSKPVRYLKDAILCYQGEIGSKLFIIDAGAVDVVHVDGRNKRRTLETKKADNVFGETAVLIGEPFKTTYIASEDSDVLTIHREDLHDLTLQYPALRARLLEGLPDALRNQYTQERFDWLLEGELTVLRVRKHWWGFVQGLPIAIALIAAVVIVAIIATAVSSDMVVTAGIWAGVILLVSLVWLFQFFDWRNDDYVVTNRRVVHVERVLLVRVERREATIDKVQNVQIVQPGFLQKMVGVSDVLVSTAAVHGTITFANVENGAAIRDKIFDQMQRAQAQRMFEAREKLKEEIRADLEKDTAPVIVYPPKTANAIPSAGISQPPKPPLRQAIAERFAVRVKREGSITWRKHWLALFIQGWKPAAGMAVVLILFGALLFGGVPRDAWLLLLIAFVVFAGWFLWEFIDWSNDIYMVTKDRLVDVERSPLGVLTKPSVEAPLSAVQNVSYRQPQFWMIVFNVGEVLIETAGQTGQLIFFWMSPPSQVANEILQYVDRARERQRQQQRAQQRADMLEWLGAYHGYLEDGNRLHDQAPDDSAKGDPVPPDAG